MGAVVDTDASGSLRAAARSRLGPRAVFPGALPVIALFDGGRRYGSA